MTDDATRRAEALFRSHRGPLRTKEALAAGVHPRTLYRLRDAGVLESMSRGVFRLAELPEPAEPDLVIVATRVPRAVVCLVSALALHELTTEIPHEVHIALPRDTRTPRIGHPPLRVFRFSGPALTAGVERRTVDGVSLSVFGPEKTIADCFRFRNKIGTSVAVEALAAWLRRGPASIPKLLEFARIDGVERVLLPYLEALRS